MAAGKPHVALLAFPFASHPENLFTFARALAAATAPGSAAFSFFTSAESLASLSSAPRPGNLRLCLYNDVGASSSDGGSVIALIGEFVRAAPGNLRAAMGAAGGEKVSCVVSDAFLWMAGEVAEEMEVPWVPVWTGAAAGLLAHVYTDEIRRRIGVLGSADDESNRAKLNEHLHFIPGLSVLRVSDLPDGIVTGNIHSDFAVLLHRAGLNLPRAAAIGLNTFQGLSPAIDAEFTSIFKNPLPIGPSSLLDSSAAADDYGCLSWLDRHGPATVAYVSFGTVAVPSASELAELALGLESSGVPFLWSLKDKARDGLPSGFLDRTKDQGLVVPWAPQVRILGHEATGVIVTHCGWNSLMESIMSRVPMVCRPFFGDHTVNARMVAEEWRIGLVIERVTAREEIVTALNVVLREEEGKRMRERAGLLNQLAAQAVANGGSSRENLKRMLEIVLRK